MIKIICLFVILKLILVSDDDCQVDPFYKTEYKIKEKSFIIQHLQFEKQRLKGFKVINYHIYIQGLIFFEIKIYI
jgi:hypothetical protein